MQAMLPLDRRNQTSNLLAAAGLISFLNSDEFASVRHKLASPQNRLVLCHEDDGLSCRRRKYFLNDQGLFCAWEQPLTCEVGYRRAQRPTEPEPCTPMQLVRAYRRSFRRPSDLLNHIRQLLAIQS